MERTVRGGERQAYTAAVTDLWERVGTALTRLERIAESPSEALIEEHSDELPSLQYALHASAELAVGIDPPPSAATLHGELVDALAEARDATADVAFALEAGDSEAVESLLHEWRGTLFRVRLARLRAVERTRALARQRAARTAPESRGCGSGRSAVSAIIATLLILGGAFLFTAGGRPLSLAGLGPGPAPLSRGVLFFFP